MTEPHPSLPEAPPARVRTKILETALGIVAEQPISRLTLDAVARAAGVSKGGLLYHFPSKQALIEGMTSYATEVMANLCEQHYARLDDGPNRWLRAYVLAAFEITDGSHHTLGPVLLSAAVHNPELIPPIEASLHRLVERVMEGASDRDLALVVLVALDGLWLHNAFNLKSLGASERSRLKQRLMAMLELQD